MFNKKKRYSRKKYPFFLRPFMNFRFKNYKPKILRYEIQQNKVVDSITRYMQRS